MPTTLAPSPKLTDTECAELYSRALAAGKAAATATTPEPMVVQGHGIREVVADGPCGFAWIKVRPANSRFAKWAVKKGIGRRSEYEGGVIIWVHDYRQSMALKEAHAYAVARVLSEAGIHAYSQSRMD